MLRSFVSVIVGFVTVAILSIATDRVLEAVGVFPSSSNVSAYTTWMLVFALFYRSIYTIIGGYVTAKLAPRKIMEHVYALMVLGGIGGVAGAISGWSLGNHWYPVLLALTGPLFVFVGGRRYRGGKKE